MTVMTLTVIIKEFLMPKFIVQREWRGYCRGRDTMVVEAASEEEAVEKAKWSEDFETDIVRDDRHKDEWEAEEEEEIEEVSSKSPWDTFAEIVLDPIKLSSESKRLKEMAEFYHETKE